MRHLLVRHISMLVLLLLPTALTAQTTPAGGVQSQAQQLPCLPENEPCGGGGGTGSVTVLPDDGQMTAYTGTAGNVAEFTVANNYSSSYVYSLTCSSLGAGTCTAIKNVAGTSITSINLGAGATAEVAVFFTAASSPASGFVKLTASNGSWSDLGTYQVTVTPPPAIVSVTPDSGTQYVGANTPAPYVFTVANLGLASQSYTLTCSTVGAGVCGSVSPSSATLASGASTQVTVTATSGATNGRVVLTASGPATDAGAYYLTVLPGTPGVLTIAPSAPAPGPDLDLGACVTVNYGAAAVECGALRLVHALPTTTTYGKARTPTLLYNSLTAAPAPIVGVTVAIPVGRLVPQSVEAILRVNGVERTRGTWPGAAWVGSGPRRIALSYSALADTSGVYPYQVEVAAFYPGGGRYATTVSGSLRVVNRSTSPFGSGWWLAGLEQLKVGPTVLRWTGGDGSSRLYALATPNVWTAANPNRPDTIRYDGTYYLRILPGGGVVRFDAAGRHIATVNWLGRQTTFAYDVNGVLQSIAIPRPGGTLSYTFAYSGGMLTTVTAPPIGAQTRVVQATITSGRMVSLRDPDLSLVSFGYTGSGASVTSRNDRRGIATAYTYTNGLVTSATVAGVAATPYAMLRHQITVGLCCTSEDTAKVYTRIDGPRTDVADTTVVAANTLGFPVRIVSPSGLTTRIAYEDGRWPALATKITSPTGAVVTAAYDVRGQVASQTDSSRTVSKVVGDVGVTRYATTRYEFHPRWQELTKVVPPEGDSTIIAYDSLTGNRIWQQDANGVPGRVTFGYNSYGQVVSVRQGGVRLDSLSYDALGNLASQVDPLGYATTYTRDQIGRDTLIATPIDTLRTFRFTRLRRYDLADRVWFERSYGPAVQEGGTDTLEVRTWFNGEGWVDSLSRRAIPDENTIGAMVTHYTFDNLGRRVREIAPDLAKDSVLYDPAGNVIAALNRRGQWITSAFDAENRLVQRIIPSVTYPRLTSGFSDEYARVLKDTLPNGDYLIPADTLVYSYDAGGNAIRADNGAAHVRRVFSPSGQLLIDSLRIRTYAPISAGGSFTQHQYVVQHDYDLDGRPTGTTHPLQLAPVNPGGQSGVETYSYNATGGLAGIGDILGRSYQIHYNVLGRVDTLTYPQAGVREVFTYDVAGHRTREVGYSPQFLGTDSGFVAGLFRQDLLRYDGRGKVVWAGALRDTVTNYYNARGAIVHSDFIDETGPDRWHHHEDFGVDALLNTTWHDVSRGSNEPVRTHFDYQSGAGRQTHADPVGTATWTKYFDVAGNLTMRHTLEWVWSGINDPVMGPIYVQSPMYARSFYSAGDRLVVSQVTRAQDNFSLEREAKGTFLSFFEESRYDAFGRRVLKRSRGLLECANHSLVDCIPSIERYVYDGNALLWEIRYPGEDSVSAAGLERDTVQFTGDSRYFGRIGYTNSHVIDRPLGMFRVGYGRDYGDGGGFRAFGLLPVSLHYNWRLLPDLMIYDNGASKRCQRYYTGATLRTRCVEVLWPARSAFLFKQKHPDLYPPSWMGSMARDGEDDTGLLYRRNRFYDPSNGRFTQEDPKRLAGGANLYAYAGSDPISYSDPFGLCVPWPWCDAQAAAEYWAAQSAASTSKAGRLANNIMGGTATLVSDGEHAAATGIVLATAGLYALTLRMPMMAAAAGTGGVLGADKLDDLVEAAQAGGSNPGQKIQALSQAVGSLRLGQSNAVSALEQGIAGMNFAIGGKVTAGGNVYLIAEGAKQGVARAIQIGVDGATAWVRFNVFTNEVVR